MDDKKYIADLLPPVDVLLDAVDRQGCDVPGTQPPIGHEVGRLLAMLVIQTNAQRVLELGTGLGYGSIWLGRALLETGGRLLTIENNPGRDEIARQNLVRLGLDQVVEIVCGDAAVEVKKLTGPYDLILQDSAKSLYPQMLPDCLRLLREGGWLAADDALFPARDVPDRFREPIAAYNELVLAEPRLYSTLLPIGDGVMLSLKRRSK